MSSTPPKECFGLHWEAQHVACAGGLDPTYTNPKAMEEIRKHGVTSIATHRRDRCSWYSQCGSRKAASSLNQQAQIIPVQQLTRPQQAAPSMPQSFQSVVMGMSQGAQLVAAQARNIQVPQMQPLQQVQQQQPQQYMQPFVGQSAPLMVSPSTASVPWAVPMNYQAQGAQMPAYLTVPEPIVPGQGTFQPLMYTILRSVLKAGCHSIANFYDHVPMTAWQPQQYSQSPPGRNPGT